MVFFDHGCWEKHTNNTDWFFLFYFFIVKVLFGVHLQPSLDLQGHFIQMPAFWQGVVEIRQTTDIRNRLLWRGMVHGTSRLHEHRGHTDWTQISTRLCSKALLLIKLSGMWSLDFDLNKVLGSLSCLSLLNHSVDFKSSSLVISGVSPEAELKVNIQFPLKSDKFYCLIAQTDSNTPAALIYSNKDWWDFFKNSLSGSCSVL